MSFPEQVFVILACFFIGFIYYRGYLAGMKRYQLNNSALKKRRKEETFKDWLFYSKFKEEIPPFFLIIYFGILLIHLISLIICFIFEYIFKLSFNLGDLVARSIYYFDVIWMFIHLLLCHSPRRDAPYERWVTKKRGMPPRKRK